MCLGTPDIPPPPPPPQEQQAADSVQANRKSRQSQTVGNGTILTGSQGLGAGALNTGGNTLLGG